MLGHALCHALSFHSQTITHSITNNQSYYQNNQSYRKTINPTTDLLLLGKIYAPNTTLFERMNNNGNLNPPPKTVAPDSDTQGICKQISDVLEQWTGKRAQNYFELKHIFQLLNTFSAERYHGNGLNLVLQ